MVAKCLVGGTLTPCASRPCGREGLASPLLSAWPRVVINRHKKMTLNQYGGQHATSSPTKLGNQSYNLAGETAALQGAEMCSADLNDMCTLQLGMLYQLLSRAGTSYSSMQCTVYARNFTSVGPGQVKLVRVAQFPIEAGQDDDLQIPQHQLLLHTEQSWALQGGSAAVDPSAMIEDCLLHREVVALPSSSSLVFPLVDCGVLVGLLVVEMQADRLTADAGQQLGTGPLASGVGTAAVTMLPELYRMESAASPSDQGATGSGAPSSAVLAAVTVGYGASDVSVRPPRSLTDEELQCLRLAVPLLAKACGMDARAGWQLAQSSVTAATARGLLREVQRPLSTLNTFSKMLLPRLKDGDPDKDMAQGILVQGKRLQDLMWQLEDALHGPAVAGSSGGAATLGPSAGAHPSGTSMSVVLPPGGGGGGVLPGAQQGPTLTTPPFRSHSALPRDLSPAVQELLSLPQPRTAALPVSSRLAPHQPSDTVGSFASASSKEAPVEGSLQTRGLEAAIGPADLESAPPRFGSSNSIIVPGHGPVLPGRVTFVERPPAHLHSGSSTDGSMTTTVTVKDALTIREPPLYTQQSSGRSSSCSPSSGEGVRVRGPNSGHSVAATIDVEMDECSTSGSNSGDSKATALDIAGRLRGTATVGTNRNSSAFGWDVAHLSGIGGGVAMAAVVSTNLASALAGVLTAAYRLAAVSGIGFIVNSPLSAVLPRRPSGVGSTTVKSRPETTAAAASVQNAPADIPGAALEKPRQQQQQPHASIATAGALSEMGGEGSIPPVRPRLIPRPSRPLLVGVSAALVQRTVSYIVDIALQCTPRGGQVCVSARQDGAGVQVQVLHSGHLNLQRLHVRSRSMQQHHHHHHHQHTSAAHFKVAASAASLHAARSSRPVPHHSDIGGLGGGGAVAVAARPIVGNGSAGRGGGGGGGGGGGTHVGSGVLSVEMAKELVQQAGGHLTVSYPYSMVSARSGSLDMGTSVEIWLPGPGAHN